MDKQTFFFLAVSVYNIFWFHFPYMHICLSYDIVIWEIQQVV